MSNVQIELADLMSALTRNNSKACEPAGNDRNTLRDWSFEVGKSYMIRTVTVIDVGRVVEITKNTVVLTSASWVAYTGRFAEVLRTGELDEVEPYLGDDHISLGAIVNFTEWNHPLPKEAK